MWRFMAVLGLAMVGLAGVVYSGLVVRVAFLNAFVVGAVLPMVLTPTRSWRQAFWRCFELVYAASAIAAAIAAHVTHAPRLHALLAGIVPALVFGTMAAFGVDRSALAEFKE